MIYITLQDQSRIRLTKAVYRCETNDGVDVLADVEERSTIAEEILLGVGKEEEVDLELLGGEKLAGPGGGGQASEETEVV